MRGTPRSGQTPDVWWSALARVVDFDTAEDALAEAVADPWQSWPARGVPRKPTGWLATTAHRNALDRLRGQERRARLLQRPGSDPTWAMPVDRPVSMPVDRPVPTGHADAGQPIEWEPTGADEGIPMLFAACHPPGSATCRPSALWPTTRVT